MTPYYERNGIAIYCGDCLEVMPGLSGIDLVITDPPYGIGKAEWDESFPITWYSVAKQFAKMIVIITGSVGLADTVPLVGEDFIDVIAGWNTNGMTRGPLGFGNWLAAVVAVTPPQKPIGQNVIRFCVGRNMPNHPSPKPIEYMEALVERVTNPNDLILDPFMGSGTTLVAAQNKDRRAVGIEISEEYCKICIERLRQPSFFSLPIFTKPVNSEQLPLLQEDKLE